MNWKQILTHLLLQQRRAPPSLSQGAWAVQLSRAQNNHSEHALQRTGPAPHLMQAIIGFKAYALQCLEWHRAPKLVLHLGRGNVIPHSPTTLLRPDLRRPCVAVKCPHTMQGYLLLVLHSQHSSGSDPTWSYATKNISSGLGLAIFGGEALLGSWPVHLRPAGGSPTKLCGEFENVLKLGA